MNAKQMLFILNDYRLNDEEKVIILTELLKLEVKNDDNR